MEIIRYVAEDGTDPLHEWLTDLRDSRAKIAIRRRIDRLERGHWDQIRAIRQGVWEMKIDVGPGYWIYYAQAGQTLILLLGDGSKRSQAADITRALHYWENWQQQNRRSLCRMHCLAFTKKQPLKNLEKILSRPLSTSMPC